MDRILRISEYVGVVFIGSLVLLTGTDVVARYFFNHSIIGIIEVVELLLTSLIAFALPVVAARREHISIDTLFVKSSSATQRILVIIASCVGIIFFGILAWQGVVYTLRSIELREATDLLEAPVFPAKLLLALGCLLTFIALLGQLLRSISSKKG